MLGWRVELERSGREGAPRCGAALMVETKQRRVMDNLCENEITAILTRMLSSRCKMLTHFAVKDVDVVLFSVVIELAFVCLCGNSSWKGPWTLT